MNKSRLHIGLIILLLPLFYMVISWELTGKVEPFHTDGIESVQTSTNPPLMHTGAPGEANCTVCHNGMVMSADGVVGFSYSGGAEYVVGQTYSITISSIAGGDRNGFQLTILDLNDNKAGDFIAGTNSGVASQSGRQYIRHTASSGITSWTFDWTAPSQDQGDLRAYYAFNRSNNSGTNSGDEIFLGQYDINSAVINDVSDYERMEEHFNAYYDLENRNLFVNYSLFDKANVQLNVQDLSGRLIGYYPLGVKSPGSHKEKIEFNEPTRLGIYIVSLFVGNQVFNRKVFF